MTQGLFIAFEGIDGCGKTTQQEMLAKHLAYKLCVPVITLSEPSGQRIGKLARSILQDRKGSTNENEKELIDNTLFNRKMMLLMTADRCENLQNVIIPALKQNRAVLCSRYILSTIAYQGRIQQDLDLINLTNQGFPNPDVTVYLDIDPEIAVQRIATRNQVNKDTILRALDLDNGYNRTSDDKVDSSDRNRSSNSDVYENLANLIGVRERYLKTLNNFSGSWISVNTGMKDAEQAHQEIKNYLESLGIFENLNNC